MTNIPFGQSHFSLLLATQEATADLEKFGIASVNPQSAPKLSYLPFMSRTEAEHARTAIEAAKIVGLTVVALYKTE
jgi:hypothetical protein